MLRYNTNLPSSDMGIHPHRTVDDPLLSHALREIDRMYSVRVDVAGTIFGYYGDIV